LIEGEVAGDGILLEALERAGEDVEGGRKSGTLWFGDLLTVGLTATAEAGRWTETVRPRKDCSAGGVTTSRVTWVDWLNPLPGECVEASFVALVGV
jgi:hypothetical protein